MRVVRASRRRRGALARLAGLLATVALVAGAVRRALLSTVGPVRGGHLLLTQRRMRAGRR
jgi:hypothetical protein